MTITIYELLIILTFILTTLMTIIHIVGDISPKLGEILNIANILPCYHIKVYRNGRLLKRVVWLQYINYYVNYCELTDGILYIQIY